MNSKRNVSIQLIRVIAMFMIIFDHIFCYLSFPMQSVIVQVANSGVFIFIFVSGFLFSKKSITNWKNWFKRRLIRICVPLWIFMAIDFIVEAVLWNVFDIKYVFIYAFNLQGILGVNIGGTNLWFLTLIMICYLITPIFQWVKSKKPGRMVAILSLIGAITLQIILAYVTDIGMVAGHTLSWCVIAIGMYAAGYFAGIAILPNRISTKRICFITTLAVILSVIVLIFNRNYDGKIIYDRILIFYGMVVIDLWICTVLYKLGQYIQAGRIRSVINHLDSISYEFYIVHGLIIVAVTQPRIGQIGTIAYICSTIIFSFICAWVLHGVCSLVYRKIR